MARRKPIKWTDTDWLFAGWVILLAVLLVVAGFAITGQRQYIGFPVSQCVLVDVAAQVPVYQCRGDYKTFNVWP